MSEAVQPLAIPESLRCLSMKKTVTQFLAAAAGSVSGGIFYAFLWPFIDRFFYDAFGIVLQCDGCLAPSLSLLYVAIPCTAAVFVCVYTRVFFKSRGFVCLRGALLSSVCIGGTISLLAVQIASGLTAAVLVACTTGAAATAGCNYAGRMKLFEPAPIKQ
jgi:hypothetical protein